MFDLETLITESAANQDLIEQQCCIEDDNLNQAPEAYKLLSLRYAALNALHFGHRGINKMCGDAAIFWWPNKGADIERKAKTCSACLNAGKTLKCPIPCTEKTKVEPPQNPGEKLQMEFNGNINRKDFEYSPFKLVAVDSNSQPMTGSKNVKKY